MYTWERWIYGWFEMWDGLVQVLTLGLWWEQPRLSTEWVFFCSKQALKRQQRERWVPTFASLSAKQCPICHHRFFAKDPRREYCSMDCGMKAVYPPCE